MKKRILGLDLGAASIGWALIEEKGNALNILGLGSRIIPYEGTEGREFEKGTGESRNFLRTRARNSRRAYDRYQQRRENLVAVLLENEMMPDETLKSLPKLQLWELRSRAVTEDISKQEFGRILLWLNQKRGYKSCRRDLEANKKNTVYVEEVENRYEYIKKRNQTIGQYFYTELKEDEYFRVKENIFPREAYIEEFDRICRRQSRHLTDKLTAQIRNEIIYYQRPLKSQKGLVSVCDFEGFWITKNEKEYFVGPKVAPKSSPLFQVEKIWENINNIRLSLCTGEDYELTLEQKKILFDYLDRNEKLTALQLFNILGLDKNDFIVNKQIEKGIPGNITKAILLKCLDMHEAYLPLLDLNLNIVENEKEVYLRDRKTGAIISQKAEKVVSPQVEKEPLYQLWHAIYSIPDHEDCCLALESKFGIDKITAEKLAGIDFNKFGFGNKSVKAIRKILPYLMEGDGYSQAMCYAGYAHCDVLTKDENLKRKLRDKLSPVQKNALRQPVVEKILNQMINLVNAIIDQYGGAPNEIRIELARELKQSKDERNKTDKQMSRRQRENDEIKRELTALGLRATLNNIIKYRLYKEIGIDEKKQAVCMYCGEPISFMEALRGDEVDVEHIIPKSKLFDDSQSNKTLAHRSCNAAKNDLTAYDFMKTKPEKVFNDYLERVNSLYANNVISKAKRDKFLMAGEDIPDDFIDRQLRESQYIARKSCELLRAVCRNVWTTSGTVTAELRRLWGWDDVTMCLQFPKYKSAGLTEIVNWENNQRNYLCTKEVITGWEKRDDHRHHAIDALVIACTKQGFIQRFNTLSSAKTKYDMEAELIKKPVVYKEKLSLLEKYIVSQQPFSISQVEDAVSNILVSFKPGKKVAVLGVRKTGRHGNKKIVQTGIIVPRGALSEESIYGRIRVVEKDKPVKYLLENPQLIVSPLVKSKVEERLLSYGNDIKKTLDSFKESPVYLDDQKTKMLKSASCFKYEYVIKYKVDAGFNKLDKVVDCKVKEILQKRLEKFGGKPREAFKDVQYADCVVKWYEDEGLERPIHSVRCMTGLSAVVPLRKDEAGNETGFVKPGNNHHVAIYHDGAGNRYEHVCTFWNAVERKKYGLPVIVENTDELWSQIASSSKVRYPESFLQKLPHAGLRLDLSMQQNEMFLLGLSYDEAKGLIDNNDKKLLSDYLYRVQKISTQNYVFRHHLETQLINAESAKRSKRFINTRSLNTLFELFPYKVRIDYLGNLVSN